MQICNLLYVVQKAHSKVKIEYGTNLQVMFSPLEVSHFLAKKA